jgi:hypothetical protein
MSNPVPNIAQKPRYNSKFKTRCIKFFMAINSFQICKSLFQLLLL